MAYGESERTFYISHKGKKHGPFTIATLSSRHLSHDMLGWTDGMPDWLPIAEIPELAPYVRHAAVSRTTAPPRGLSSQPKPEPAGGPVMPAVPQRSEIEPPPPRSVLATTMGIFNIIFATLGLLCLPIVIFSDIAIDVPATDVVQEITMSATARTGRVVNSSVALVVSLLFLIAGIGLVRRRKWGRIMSILAANASIFLQIGSCVTGVITVAQPLYEVASTLEAPDIQAAMFGAVGCLACGPGAVFLYDIFLLIAMSFQTVKKSLL